MIRNQNNFGFYAVSAFFVLLSLNQVWATESSSIRALNPNIGVNFLTKYEQNSFNQNEGFAVQEAELSMKADVDPYLTASVMLSVSPKTPGGDEYSINPEELFVETIFIPKLTLRAGKFYGAFGKHNLLHTHAFPFVDAPLVSSSVLGNEGFNQTGVSAALLLPTTWYSEMILQSFGNSRNLAHYRNLFDLNDDTTLEFGISGMTQWAWGVDLTLKHRPTGTGQGRRFNLGAEWISGLNQLVSLMPTQGVVAYFQYEFIKQTYIQYRFDDVLNLNIARNGALLGYAPTEFSAFRVQYDLTRLTTAVNEHRVIAQMNISIGAHPAHDY